MGREHHRVIKRDSCLGYRQSNGIGAVTFKIPNARYGDYLLKLKCGPELLALGVWPNWKEVTEAIACWRATIKHLRNVVDPGDTGVTAVVVGDGSTPRLGALLAFLTRWSVVSVDPNMRLDGRYEAVKRLTLIKGKIESTEFSMRGPAVVYFPHAHVDCSKAMGVIDAKERHVIAMPCCTELTLPKEPVAEYADWGIWSPERVIRVWQFV